MSKFGMQVINVCMPFRPCFRRQDRNNKQRALNRSLLSFNTRGAVGNLEAGSLPGRKSRF